MNHRAAPYATVLVIALAAFLCAAAATAGNDPLTPGTREQIDSLNAFLEKARPHEPSADLKAASGLIDRIYERGPVPVIVRLRDKDLPYGMLSDMTKPRPEVIDALQSTVVGDVIAQTSCDEAGLHVKRFSMIPAMALQADVPELEALLAHPNVIDIVEDIPVPPALQESVPLIGAGADGSFSTYTGLGQAVAILDTGVEKNHPFLTGKVVSEACYSSDVPADSATSLCPGGAAASTAANSALNCDPAVYGCDHGTHVAGIAAGNGSTFSGVAKDASIIAIQIFSRFSSGCGSASAPCAMSYPSDQIKGLERVYALRNSWQIASANMSLGGGSYSSPCNLNTLKPVIDSLREEGIATVISSGNGSSTTSLGSPGCIGSAVSVGSTTKADAVSSFSNSADFLALLAPGSTIKSSVPVSSYLFKSGTSMAAPHVAGAWAVLKQARPDAGVTEVLEALQFTGVPIADTRTGADSRIKPRIDVQAALDALLAPGAWIRRDDGVQINAHGLAAGGTLSVASRWQPADIPNEKIITKIRVGVHDVPADAAVQIWQGSDASSMELQYSQAFTPAARQINEIILAAPYVIDPSKELLIGWSATHGPGQYPFALDADADPGLKGNLQLLDGSWQNLGSPPGDWLVHAYLVECLNDGRCDDGRFCNGAETCAAGGCAASTAPCTENETCVEESDQCVELPPCILTVTHKELRAEKLLKPKTRTLKITGGEDFDLNGALDLGPLQVLKTKVDKKKAVLKVKVLVPAGLGQGTVQIRVGRCRGSIEIL